MLLGKVFSAFTNLASSVNALAATFQQLDNTIKDRMGLAQLEGPVQGDGEVIEAIPVNRLNGKVKKVKATAE